MNFIVITIFCIFIISIYAKLNIIYKNPDAIMSTDTHEFQIESKIKIDLYSYYHLVCLVNEKVNQPAFPAYIHIYNAMTKARVYKMDVSINNSNITYVNKTLIFHIPASDEWDINTNYYITLDEGVLYSDNVSNSTAQTSSTFWRIEADVDHQSSMGTITDISSTNANIEPTEGFTNESPSKVTETSKPTTTIRALVTGNV